MCIIPSPFRRSARPFRLLAASARSRSRSLSRCSFSRWLRAAAPRGFCLGAAFLELSSSDSKTGEPLGDLDPVRCRLTSIVTLAIRVSNWHVHCWRSGCTHSSLSSRLRFLRLPFSASGTAPSCLLSSKTFRSTSSSS